MKKHTLVMLIITANVFTLLAQAPQKFSYQAVIRNTSDQLIKNGNVGLRMSVIRGSESGTVVYQEIFNPNPTTNINGLLTVQIGGGIAITGNFSTIDWAAGPYFIRTEADPTGGTNYMLQTTSPLLSIPYALLAKNVENIPSIHLDELTDVNSLTAQPGQVLKWNGTAWIPANDNTGGSGGPTYTAGSGISIDGNNVITNTGDGDNNAQNEFQKLSLSGNELTLFPNGNSVTLPIGGGGSDNWGSQTVATNTSLTGNGTVTNPLGININSINQTHIQDQSISAADLGNMGAQNGQVLKWNGQSWAPANDDQGNGNSGSITINSGNGITVNPTSGSNFTITNTSPGNLLNLQAGNGIAISGSWPNYQIVNTTSNTSPWFVNASNRAEYNGVGAVVTNNNKSATLDSDGLSFKVSSTVLPITYTGSEIVARGPLTYARMEAGEIKTGFNNSITNYLSFKPEGIIKSTTLGSDEFALGFLDNFNQTTKQLIVKLNGVDVANSIKIGSASSVSPVSDGTIQFANGDFQGRIGGQWKSFTKEGLSGTGTVQFIPKFTGTTTLGNSNLSTSSSSIGDKLLWSSTKDGEFVVSGISGGTTAVQGFIAARGSTSLSSPFVSIGSTSNHQLRLLTNNAERLTILENGNIGIGNTAPSAKLDISGTLIVRSIPSTSSTTDLRTDATGNILKSTSDLRLKKNIRNIKSALEKVNNLRPVLFDWKDNPSAINQFGFIAQEVNEVLPEVVNHDKESDYFSLDYTEIIPVLTKAIQEQQVMIEHQNKKIEALIQKIENLEKK